MKWTERDFQEYRQEVCGISDISTACECCAKTGDEIEECYWDLYFHVSDDVCAI